jgi:hypothetical protein
MAATVTMLLQSPKFRYIGGVAVTEANEARGSTGGSIRQGALLLDTSSGAGRMPVNVDSSTGQPDGLSGRVAECLDPALATAMRGKDEFRSRNLQ